MSARNLGAWVVFAAVLPGAAASEPGVVVKQLLPPSVIQGQGFTSEVVVTNAGSSPAEEVRLTGSWSGGYRLTDAAPAPATPGEKRAEWSVGRVGAGETRRVRLTFAPTSQSPGGEFRSEFEASFRGTRADVQTIPVQQLNLDLAVSTPAVALVGQPLQVHVALKNPGAAEVKGVTLSSQLPDGLSHPSGADLQADVGVVPAGHTEAVPLTLTPTKSGPVRAVFKISGGGVLPVEREIQLVALDAKLELEMAGPKTLPQSWPGTFEVTVRNTGAQAAPGATLDVAVPAGFDDLRATEGAKFDPTARKLVWQLGDLKPGESRTLVWLAVAGKPGDQQAAATIRLGSAPAKTAEWTTRVQ